MAREIKPHLSYDPKTRRIFGFFVAKGLLVVPGIEPRANVKLDIAEVLKVGTEIEPRVLEVLPAALLHFPRTFLNWAAVPDKLNEVLRYIAQNSDHGPDLAGLPYNDLKRWANHVMSDKRTVPIHTRRVMKSLRLKPSAIKILAKRAKAAKLSQSELLEKLLEQ